MHLRRRASCDDHAIGPDGIQLGDVRVLLAISFVLIVGSSSGFSQMDWQAQNLFLFGGGVPGAFDNNSVRGPMVVEANGEYLMWYHGANSIGCARSLDGIQWDKCLENPVLAPVFPWEGCCIFHADVLYDESTMTYRMWYLGAPSDGVCDIGHATSDDGVLWERVSEQPVLQGYSRPNWESGCIGASTVVFDGEVYKMWYSGISRNFATAIGLAISTDGLTWEKYEENPVVRAGGADTASGIAAPTALFDELTETYELWYDILDGGPGDTIAYATSMDGKDWVKHGRVRIAGDPGGGHQPTVRFDGTTYHLWYNRDNTIRYATSEWEVPKSSFTASPETGVAPLTVTLDATKSASPVDGGLAYAWDFGDGTSDQGMQVPHVYVASGVYRITLTVTDAAGNIGKVARRVEVVVSEPVFRRADPNGDQVTDLADGVFILNHLFLGRGAPGCMKSADANDSGDVDIADGTYIFSYLFVGGPAPPAPFPGCGVDPVPDALSCLVAVECP